jgi:DNA-binding transcriptional LysR family regulator
MELRHLRYFVAVAETLNFSRAAVRLHVTQPALSRQIRDLEQELGCLLLRRGANARTELTPEGRRLLAGARSILAATETLTAEVRAQATQLRFGHYGALWLNYFTPALRRFAKRHPQIMLQPADLTPGTLPGALRRGEIDLALLGLADAAVRREFQTRQVGALPARLALAAGHPLAKRRKLRLAELREATWVSWDEKEFPGRKQLLVDACRRAGFRPRIAYETDSIASLFVRVATSDAIGQVLPMSNQLPHEGVVFAELDPPNAMCFEMFVAWRRNEPRDALIDALVAELAATAGRQA